MSLVVFKDRGKDYKRIAGNMSADPFGDTFIETFQLPEILFVCNRSSKASH